MEIESGPDIVPTTVGRRATAVHLWHRLTLIGILLLAVFLNFYRLGQEGYANLYYTAAVKSMLSSWHNFFFVSFDSAGFVSVDKPPLGLWIQTASAALLGFSGLSVLLPQALAGVLSVFALLYGSHDVQSRRVPRRSGSGFPSTRPSWTASHVSHALTTWSCSPADVRYPGALIPRLSIHPSTFSARRVISRKAAA